MAKRPIIFSGPMVQAILDGRKTQTRRIVKGASGATSIWGGERDGLWSIERFGEPCQAMIRCPYGHPGDVLWVRETWQMLDPFAINYQATPTRDGQAAQCLCSILGLMIRRDQEAGRDPYRWRVPIFMPHWACRLFLQVLSVRVERVQEISEEDVHAEGVDCDLCDERFPGSSCDNPKFYYQRQFANLWDSINAKKGPVVKASDLSHLSLEAKLEFLAARKCGHAWAANPWVWVVEFKVANAPGGGEGG